jgi:hypothetical protein
MRSDTSIKNNSQTEALPEALDKLHWMSLQRHRFQNQQVVGPFAQPLDHVVVGSRSVLVQEDQVPCGIVAFSTLQWLWIADTLGHDPE